ncbi:MAG: dihydropteroate synthase [Rhodospirillales bacterium]|nr:dihydropteroate synthase [Rhodospirillales bacterium]
MPAAVPLTQTESEDAEGALAEPRVRSVYLRPCNPVPGETLAFDLVDVLFRGMPARRRVRLQHAVLARWAERNAPVAADEIAHLSSRLALPRGPICGLTLDRPRLMGVLNVTPDSFSDGGDFAAEDDAISHGRAMAAAGADIVDVGGESTRPGSRAPNEAEEMRRVIPVIHALAGDGLLVSVDTRRATVMEAALAAGARIVNDMSALRHDPEARAVIARNKAWVVLAHMQGTPETMQREPRYDDASLDVFDAIAAHVSAAEAAGIQRGKIIVDPGIGFGKTARHNLEILRDLALFHGLGCPLLVGASRKSFVGRLSAGEPPKQRFPGSLAAGLHALGEGAHILRVHDVTETRQALAMWRGIRDPEAAVAEVPR